MKIGIKGISIIGEEVMIRKIKETIDRDQDQGKKNQGHKNTTKSLIGLIVND